jgi:acetylornithine deacetylase/succinyl-diaminopimelate desuccinylase-like protein
VELLQRRLRVNTVNPPGNETAAVAVLQEYLGQKCVASQVFAREPARANLVARVEGGDGPTLLLMAHTDT